MYITMRLARVPPLPEQTAAVRRDFGYEARAVARPGGRARNEGAEAVQGRRRRLGRPRGRLGPRAGARAARRDAAGAQSCETCAPARAPAGAVRAAAVGGRRDARAVRRGRAALAARDDGDAAAAALGDACVSSASLFFDRTPSRRRRGFTTTARGQRGWAQTTHQNAGTGSRGASAARPAARRPAAKPKPAATPAPAPEPDAWDANDDLDDILGDGWDDDSPTSKSVSPPPRSLSSLSGAVSPGEDSDDDFFASLGMESKPKFRK